MQSAQLIDGEALNLPAAHSPQLMAPGLLRVSVTEPTPHVRQVPMATLGAYIPVSQAVHGVRAEGLYWPAPQAVHVVAAGAVATVPSAQAAQAKVEALLN